MNELKYYKVFVPTKETKSTEIVISDKHGFFTTKPLHGEDLLDINSYYSENKLSNKDLQKTLFTYYEQKRSEVFDKVLKQIMHYMTGENFSQESTLEIDELKTTFDIIRVIDKQELLALIENDIYNSKPLDSEKVCAIFELINKYSFVISFSKIKNNELKSYFIENFSDKILGITGDDIVRTVVKIATDSSLLIKSKEVLSSLDSKLPLNILAKINGLFNLYQTECSQVFNRHKKIFLTLKKNNKDLRHIINKISKLSKKNHVPVYENFAKHFISKYSKPPFSYHIDAKIKQMKPVDKMKILYLLQVYKAQPENRVFIIRNGKAFIKDEKLVCKETHEIMYNELKKSLVEDLSHLKDKKILYPEDINYALPISEKQSCGHLPFGTEIFKNEISTNKLVAGMYWKNEWGAKDLDLSSVSISGERIGWGSINAYSNNTLFSGDITNAPNGAIEYLSNKSKDAVVLINNIFNGEAESKFKIVIGKTSEVTSKYNGKTIVELDCKFIGKSKSMTLGALYPDKFILYPLSVKGRSVSSSKDASIIPKMILDYPKLKELLIEAGANIITDKSLLTEDEIIDIDLSVENITFDKLSNLFNEKISKEN